MADATSSNAPLPVAVFGCGRMGRLHARVYSEMPSVRLAGVYDRDEAVAAETAQLYGGEVFKSPQEAVGKVKAATVAVPTVAHLEVAGPLLENGVACLIEKPLAKDAAEGRAIVELAAKHRALVQVGHIERFNPAVRSLRKLDIRPRFIEVTRISPLTFRSIDVGVVLDVMIHDIDIVLSLAGSTVERVDAQGVSIIGGGTGGRPVEDICSARLTFANGCVANLTASRLALKTERRLRVFSPEAYVSLDYQKKYGILVRRHGEPGPFAGNRREDPRRRDQRPRRRGLQTARQRRGADHRRRRAAAGAERGVREQRGQGRAAGGQWRSRIGGGRDRRTHRRGDRGAGPLTLSRERSERYRQTFIALAPLAAKQFP